MHHLEISLLGPYSVRLDGKPLTAFGYQKVRALLAYLAVQRSRPNTREQLMGMLWPDVPERRARQSLSRALSTLRDVLGERGSQAKPGALIEATRQAVRLSPDADIWVDIEALEARLNAVTTHPHARLSTCDACLEQLTVATDLYRGSFLEDLSLSDNAPFEEWALLMREQLRRQTLEALQQLAGAYLQRGDYEEAATYARRELVVAPWDEVAHRQLMRALALSGQRNAALAQYEACSDLLADALGVAPEPATTALYTAIRDGDLVSQERDTQEEGLPPFKGLEFFDVCDAQLFFGREELTQRLLRRIAEGEPFLAIIGASGSGKSSLLRAGLVASLQRSSVAESLGLRAVVLTPTAHPLQALCRSVIGDGATTKEISACQADLLIDARRLRVQINSRLAQDRAGEGERVLLVVDQFEELFTLCRDPASRRAFINAIVDAPAHSATVVQVVIALRADLYHYCADFERLRGILEDHQAYIGAMTPQELRRAILGPANQGGWALEPGLVDLLLHDVGAAANHVPEPGALPLLSHVLLETWQRREGNMLTLKGYADAGGVHGAIAQTAEAVYRTLNAGEQQIARVIFLRLTNVGDLNDSAAKALYTRRRASLEELVPASATDVDVQGVLNTLAHARLITMERDTVEVAHEALIREWPTLRGWLEADLDGLRLHRHLTQAAQAWVDGGRDAGDLYRGARLAQAEEWLRTEEQALNSLEHEFLAASQAESERLDAAREDQRQRELAAARHLAESQKSRAEERGRLLRWLGVAASLLLIAAVAATLLGRGYRAASLESAGLADINATTAAQNAAVAATAQAAEATAIAAREQEAEQRSLADAAREKALLQTRIAKSGLLAVQSGQFLNEDYALALLLSVEAYRAIDTPEARGSMLAALEAYPGVLGLMHTPVNELLSVAFSPDGSRLAAVGTDSTLGIWLYVWDVRTRQLIREPDPVENPGFSWTFHMLDYSPDGRVLAVGACGKFDEADNCVLGEIALRDAQSGQVLSRVEGHTDTVRGVAYDSAGTRLVSYGDKTVLLWDVHDTHTAEVERRLEGHTTPVSAAAFSPDGTLLATVGFDIDAPVENAAVLRHTVRLWDAETGVQVREFPFAGKGFYGLAFSSDGRTLAASGCNQPTTLEQTRIPGCEEGLVRRWDVATGEELLPAIVDHSDTIHYLRFISQDAALLTTGNDRSIGLWDLAADRPSVGSIASPSVTTWAAMSPDEALLATAWHATVSFWDVARLRDPSRSRTGEILASTAPMPLGGLALSPDGSTLAVGGADSQIHLWDAAGGRPLTHTLDGHVAWSVSFSPDGKVLASGGVDSTVRLWDAHTGTSIQPPLEGHTATVTSIAFSPDGSTLASSGQDGSFRLWDVPRGKQLSVRSTRSGAPIWNAAFGPNGDRLATAVGIPEGDAVLWDVSDPTAPVEIARFPGTGGVTQVAFSPSGALLAVSTGGLKGQVLLWDLQTQQLSVAPITAHHNTPWHLTFSPDGRTLASGALNSTVRLIDVATGRLIGPPLQLHADVMGATPTGLTFSPDGQSLYSSSTDGALRRWDVDPNSWRERACAVAGRNLTQAEWTQYRPNEPYQVTCEQWPAGE